MYAFSLRTIAPSTVAVALLFFPNSASADPKSAAQLEYVRQHTGFRWGK